VALVVVLALVLAALSAPAPGTLPGTMPGLAARAQPPSHAVTAVSALAAASAAPSGGRWRRLLDTLLTRRARAYATGAASKLRSVHQPGSPVLARDRATVRAWHRRGLTVTSTVHLKRVRLLARAPGQVVLRSVDALVDVVAVDADGARRRLPDDRPTVHRVLLVSTHHGWRLGAVRTLRADV